MLKNEVKIKEFYLFIIIILEIKQASYVGNEVYILK